MWFQKKPKEITEVLEALDAIRAIMMAVTGLQTDVVDKICADIRRLILEEKDRTVHSIRIDKWAPNDLALLLVAKETSGALSSGMYHIHRGVLSPAGNACMEMFRRSTQALVKSGFITGSEAEKDIADIQKKIAGGG